MHNDTRITYKKSGKQYSYLKCSHTHGNCDQKPINEQLVFQQIEDELVGSFHFSNKALNALKSSIREYIQNENGFNRMHKQELQKRLKDAKKQLDNAEGFLLSGVITCEVYNRNKQKLENEIAEIECELNKCSDDFNEIGEIIENIIEIAANAGNLIRSSKVEQKRQIINLLLSNCELKDKKLVYSIRKPFNVLMELNGCQSWLGQLIPSAPLRLRGNRDDLTAQGLSNLLVFEPGDIHRMIEPSPRTKN